MREITGWLSPEVMRLIGLALLHFLWQGLALAALAGMAMSVFRGASSRYAIGVAALLLMVAAPPMTYFALRGSSAEPAAAQIQGPTATAAASTHVIPAAHPRKAPFGPSPEVPASSLAWLVQVWFAGVLLCSLRTAGGLLWIERLRRKDCSAVPSTMLSRCRALQERLGLARVIRYCECAHLQAPAVIGWFRPVVLLPVTALTGLSEEQLRAVIAHELAHIKRLDAFFNLFQIAAETLFFYHPAVWWLNHRIRAERENCCDDVAVEVCGNPVEYARALAAMAERRAAPSLAMAANRSPLAARVARMLGLTPPGSGRNSAGLAAGILCLSAALFAGNAFVGIARTTSAAPAPPRAQAVTARDQDTAIVVRASRLPASPQVSSEQTPSTPARPAPAPSPAPQAQPKPEPSAKPSYIDGLKAEGIDNLSIDELVSMKIQGVTPEYVHAIHELGLRPSANELVGMRIQGVKPAYIQELRGMGFTPNVDEIIGMKVQGVTPEYVKSLRDLKLKTGIGEVIGMKVQGVTPDYVKKLQDLGLQLDTGEVIGMKVQGVTPEYIQELRALGLKLDPGDIMGMKVQGVTPEYVRGLQGLGLHLDSDHIIGMKVQGVTPEYVKSLRDAGLQLDTGDLIGAKVQGITPEFIAEAKSHGFKNLDLHKLIALKQSGVFDK
jgi:beta-lactamase regulating signal transducer with metallopeptidase domain